MIFPCPVCHHPMMWEIDRVSDTAQLATKCRHCDPTGAWAQEAVEIVRRPIGKAPETIPLAWAPCDTMDV